MSVPLSSAPLRSLALWICS